MDPSPTDANGGGYFLEDVVLNIVLSFAEAIAGEGRIVFNAICVFLAFGLSPFFSCAFVPGGGRGAARC